MLTHVLCVGVSIYVYRHYTYLFDIRLLFNLDLCFPVYYLNEHSLKTILKG